MNLWYFDHNKAISYTLYKLLFHAVPRTIIVVLDNKSTADKEDSA